MRDKEVSDVTIDTEIHNKLKSETAVRQNWNWNKTVHFWEKIST